MSILVTGCSKTMGPKIKFINSYFFKNPDATLVNLDSNDSDENVDERIRYSMRYHFIKGDLSSYDLAFNILKIFNIGKIVHFVQNQNYKENLLEYTHVKVLGTHCLLEACRKYGKIKYFVHFSEECCENGPYSATKLSAELLSKSYCDSFEMPIVILHSEEELQINQK